jgi:tryptophanyl-tRNA synthetase
MKKTVFSGMRPTGKLHIGHLVGALSNWLQLQDQYRCIYGIVDWHALTTEYQNVANLSDNVIEVTLDWLSVGLDPEKSIFMIQSLVKEHAELHLLFSMIVPVPWLERVPSYKEQQQQLADRDLSTYGFLGYPLLQAADILVYKAELVPVGEDQVAHIELTREVARRFNNFYRPIFPEPQAMLAPTPRLLGTDRRKMSKSYGNVILLSDSPETVRKKVSMTVTDPARQRRTDKGNPDVCTVFDYHKVFTDKKTVGEIDFACRNATIGCVECKDILANNLIAKLEPIYRKRKELELKKDQICGILTDGSARARRLAAATMEEARDAVNINYPTGD